jgi:hypothetical protein
MKNEPTKFETAYSLISPTKEPRVEGRRSGLTFKEYRDSKYSPIKRG